MRQALLEGGRTTAATLQGEQAEHELQVLARHELSRRVGRAWREPLGRRPQHGRVARLARYYAPAIGGELPVGGAFSRVVPAVERRVHAGMRVEAQQVMLEE